MCAHTHACVPSCVHTCATVYRRGDRDRRRERGEEEKGEEVEKREREKEGKKGSNDHKKNFYE